MDLEAEKMKARLDALETALVVAARRDPGILQAVQLALTAKYQNALQIAQAEEEGGFLRNVRVEPRPSRDRLVEQIRVDAYRELIGKVQPIS
jgi:hypothetical protein